MMRRILPHPVMTGLLLLFWLLIHQSASLGHILLGSVVAIAVSLVAGAFLDERVTLGRPHKLLQLALVVGVDVIRSNIAVLIILLQRRPKPQTGFVEIPLQLTSTFGLAVLACIITATPGSAWLEYDRARGTVLIHVLDLIDPEEWAQTIKTRYESLLLEIFP